MRTLKQNRKRIDRYPWERELTTDEKMGRAINRLRFKSNVWNNSAGVPYSTVFRMVNDVRYLSGLDPMSRELFDDGIQYRTIFADYYPYALSEFRHLCWGDW
jgi:hypothetical protein